MIIFDGSGSMWGRLQGVSKFEIAIADLSKTLPNFSPEIEFGLMAYGHRRKADCSDVQIFAAPAPGQAADLIESLGRVSPRGKTPIASSLESAASLFVNTPNAHILLLTDGVENCRKDLCETVAAIRRDFPQLAISTIGLGLRAKDAERIQCIASGGSGQFIIADSANALNAGLNTILTAIARGTIAKPNSSDSEVLATTEEPQDPGPPKLKLYALHTEGGPPIEDPVAWHVVRLGDKQEAIFSGTATATDIEVQPGTYRIEARLGPIATKRDITISDQGERAVQIPLNVGRLDIRLDAPLERGETLTVVQTPGSDGAAIPPSLISGPQKASQRLYLPAGNYTVRRDSGATSSTQSVTLTADTPAEAAFSLALGRISASARLTAGSSEVPEAVFIVERRAGASDERWIEVARSAADTPDFTLPEGTYRLTARADAAKAEAIVDVRRRNTTTVILDLNAGVLVPSAVDLVNVGLPQPVEFTLVRRSTGAAASGTPIHMSRSGKPLTVPAGYYRIDAAAGETNVTSSAEVEIAPGARTEVELPFSPARVRLSLSGETSGTAAPPIEWSLFAGEKLSDRPPVWQGRTRQPVLTVAPGAYVAVARRNGKVRQQPFRLTGGQTRDVKVP